MTAIKQIFRVSPVILVMASCLSAAASEGNPDSTAANPLSLPEVQAAIAACKADRDKFCPGVVPGKGRIVMCLVANAPALDPACASALQKAASALGR